MASVGFIGIGTMGGPMARNILRKGHALAVFDLNKAAVAALVADGATEASSLPDLARRCDVVITMLPDVPDVERVVLGPGGLAEGFRRGAIYVDMSTIEPVATRRIGAALAEKGVRMLDSPVGKTVEHAVAGTLTLMVGGPEDVIEAARPVLACMGSDLIRCGDLGAGQAMKLTNNLLASALLEANCEALVGGMAAGLSYDVMIRVLSTTMAWNNQLAIAMQNRGLKGDFSPGFMVKLAHKDCRLALAMQQGMGVESPVGAATLASLEQAMDQGLADLDVTALLKLREEKVGVAVRKS